MVHPRVLFSIAAINLFVLVYSLVFDSAKIYGNALIEGDAELGGNAQVHE